MSKSRTLYEDKRDPQEIDREIEIGRAFAALDGNGLWKLDRRYELDFAVVTGGADHVVTSWLEVKSRKIEITTYPTIDVSMKKIGALLRYSILSSLPAYLVIEFTLSKAVRSTLISMKDVQGYATRIGGRYDRPDDPEAVEPLTCIPIEVFKGENVPDALFA